MEKICKMMLIFGKKKKKGCCSQAAAPAVYVRGGKWKDSGHNLQYLCFTLGKVRKIFDSHLKLRFSFFLFFPVQTTLYI